MATFSLGLRRVVHIAGRALRETGQALDRAGATIQGNYAYKEQLSRHRRIMNLFDKVPKVSGNVFVAPNATVIGDVEVGENTSIWYGAVIRGDVNFIRIGANATIGDRAVIHVGRFGSKVSKDAPTLIGNNTVIAHGATVHGCTIEDGAMVDIGATVLDGAVVSHGSILAPGSLLLEGQRIPSGELWAGSPAKFVRKLTEEEIKNIPEIAAKYRALAKTHDEYHLKSQVEIMQIEEERYSGALRPEIKPAHRF